MSTADDRWADFDLEIARWTLGKRSLEDLPGAALIALEEGCDGPTLARLAAMDGAGWSEIEPLIAPTLEERGKRLPTEQQARKLLADTLLTHLLNGTVEIETATHELGRLASEASRSPAWDDLSVFSGLSDWWEEPRFERDEVRNAVERAAREVLWRGGVTAD